jgi:hypothetical protein
MQVRPRNRKQLAANVTNSDVPWPLYPQSLPEAMYKKVASRIHITQQHNVTIIILLFAVCSRKTTKHFLRDFDCCAQHLCTLDMPEQNVAGQQLDHYVAPAREHAVLVQQMKV